MHCGWIETKSISILQSVDRQVNPSFHIHVPGPERRYRCTQTTSVVQKIVPPSALVFFRLSHLTYILSLKAKTVWKTLIFTLLNMFQKKQHFFSIFRWSITWPGSYFLLSDDRHSMWPPCCIALTGGMWHMMVCVGFWRSDLSHLVASISLVITDNEPLLNRKFFLFSEFTTFFHSVARLQPNSKCFLLCC